AEAENLECYSCADYNDGSCLEDKAAKTSCSPDQNCIETNPTLETSHSYSYLMVKDCGNRSLEDMLELVPFYGINLYFHLSQSNNNLSNEKRIYAEKSTPDPNNVQCYSCIGITGTECSSSNVSISACCEGNLCNRDLFNRTQYVDLPPLVLLEDLTSKMNSSLNMTTV
ncbi:hypothetical protein XELAEV_18036243mg, partial [Xenopus laevis]